MKILKRFPQAHRLSLLVATLALALVPGVALAVGFQSGDNITLAKGDIHHGTLYAAGKTLTVDGNVDGDFICAGNTVTINGTVSGDVLCAAQTITVNGQVDGNIRVAGQTVTLNGRVARNVSAAAQVFTLGTGATVGGDVALLGGTASVQGPVGRDLYGLLNNLNLNAPVAGNVDTEVQSLTLGSVAHVGGSMTYTSNKTFTINRDQVGGAITRHTPAQETTLSPRDAAWAWIADRAYWIAATLVIMLLLVWLAPRPLQRLTEAMLKRPAAKIGWGALVMFAGPFAVIALLLTLIGVPLAILLALAYGVAIALSGALVSLVVGHWIVHRTDWNRQSLPLMILVGVPVTLVVLGLPYLGGLLSLIAAWWVLGTLATSLRPTRA
jgi:cytoskeletal protein CcmA (bactofilin family)